MKNKKRISQLNDRIEILIKWNNEKHYTSNPEKCKKYLDILSKIHYEKTLIWVKNRLENLGYNESLEDVKKTNAKYLSKKDLFNLTAPIL